MARSERFMSTKNCPDCGHPHRSDHPHFKRFKLDDSESSPPPAARPASAGAETPPAPAATTGEPPPTPIGVARGELPGAAAEVLAQRKRKKRVTKQEKEQTAEEKASRLNACKMAVRMELAGLAVGMGDERFRTFATDADVEELAKAWDAFAQAWGIETTGKLAVTMMLAACHGGLYMTLASKVKAAGPKPEKEKEKE